MSTPPSVAFLDGLVLPMGEARIPLDDRGLLFGESLYEVVPVVAGQPRLLEAHVQRMATGAGVLGLPTAALTTEAWASMAAQLLARDSLEEGLLYVQLTGGSGPREHAPVHAPTPRLFAYLLPHRFPRSPETTRGITATFVPETRWARRDLKTTMLLPAVLAKRTAMERGADEALFVGDDDVVSEGASSNIFAVIRGELHTPALSAALLPGTMRGLVLQQAAALGIPWREQVLRARDLVGADEVFVASTSRLAMPVTRLDGVPRPEGAPCTLRLATAIRNALGIT